MTSREYWSSLYFDYAETFSLLKGEEGKYFFVQTQEKAKKETNKYKQQELLDLSIRGSITLLENTGLFHPTAV